MFSKKNTRPQQTKHVSGGGFSLCRLQPFRSVQQIVASSRAFVAILAENRSVVSWGESQAGGDCSRVYHQLKGEEDGGEKNTYGLDGSEIWWLSS